jgi:hypothetical protein
MKICVIKYWSKLGALGGHNILLSPKQNYGDAQAQFCLQSRNAIACICARNFRPCQTISHRGSSFVKRRLEFGGEATLQNVYRKGAGLYKCFVRLGEKD